MRQFNINQGVGHPLRQDDLEYMFESQKQVVKGLMSAYNLGSRDSFVISGCEIYNNFANNTYDVSAGFFCYGGEVMKVDAHSVSNNINFTNLVWAVVETNPGTKLSGNSLSNPLTYEDGSTVYPYKERKMELQAASGQAEKVDHQNVFYLNGTHGYKQPILANGSHNSSAPLRYRIYGSYLHVYGIVDNIFLTNSAVNLFTAPGYVKAYNASVKDITYFDQNPSSSAAIIEINGNREVEARYFDGSGGSATGQLHVNSWFPLEISI